MRNKPASQWNWFVVRVAWTAAIGCLLSSLVHAHGAKIEYRTSPSISLQAMYDTGDPMTTAQITVYAPNDPDKPWLTGRADANGYFNFVPDPTISGMWAIQAREAGHGAFIQIPVGNDAPVVAAASAASGASQTTSATRFSLADGGQSPLLQRWVTTAAVIWGFIGTSLFFARKRIA